MKRRIVFFIVIVVLLGAGGYWVYTRSSTSAQSGGKTAAESTYTVEKTKLRETLTISGEINAEEKVTLSFPTGGKLSWVGVKEGDYVEKYQGVASLDQRDLQKRLESSLNTFMISRWDFDQTKSDNKDAQYTDGELGEKMRRIIDKAQFGLNNSIITVELQSLAKEYAYLYTPIEGIVTRVGAPYAGVTVGATTSYEVVNPNSVYFSATADQTEVPKLRVGQEAKILVDPYPDTTVNATIQSISFTPQAGDTGTNYEVKLEFPTTVDVLKYRLGMTGDVEFLTKEKQNVYAIPTSYLLSEAGKKYVFLLKDGKKTKTEVKTGEEGDTEIEIVRGVQAGDVLVENTK
jgi:RND family efflux transporter MFP subunit